MSKISCTCFLEYSLNSRQAFHGCQKLLSGRLKTLVHGAAHRHGACLRFWAWKCDGLANRRRNVQRLAVDFEIQHSTIHGSEGKRTASGYLVIKTIQRRFSLLICCDGIRNSKPPDQEIPGGNSMILMLRKWISAPSDSRQR
jgi:hypothetical protein